MNDQRDILTLLAAMPTILILDDEEPVLRILRFFLERAGYRVNTYADAHLALQSYDFEHCDLVITDLDMPLPGEDVIAELNRRQLSVPILVMSSDVKHKRVALQAMGVQRFLDKPFTAEELLEAVGAAPEPR